MSSVESQLSKQERERKLLEEAKEKALAEGKEPFDINRVPFKLIASNCGLSKNFPQEITEHLKTEYEIWYYIKYPNVKTNYDFVEQLSLYMEDGGYPPLG